MKQAFAGLVGLGLLVACQDSRDGAVPVSGPSFDISEARFGSGNPDLFFSTPLAEVPKPGDVNFEVGAANALLKPSVRICETDGAASAAGCVTDVTQQVTGSATGLALVFGGSELYSVNWQTSGLSIAQRYRIEVWGLAATAAQANDARTSVPNATVDRRWLFGWRDIQNSPNVSRCSGNDEFCQVKYGQTLPIKVRIEQFAFCPVARNCAVQQVLAGTNANLEAQLNPSTGAPSAQLFIPGQTGTNFALAFEPCTAAEDALVSGAIDVPTFGPCVKTDPTTFTGLLVVPAIVSLCDDLDPSGFGLSESQLEQLALHHVSDDLSSIQALPEAWQCGAPTSGVASVAPKGIQWFAQAVRDKVLGWVAPRPLFAAVAMIDRGGGGPTEGLGSFFKLALPAKFEYEFATDAVQFGTRGTAYVLRVRATDFLGAGVQNARVRWSALTPPSGGATVLGVAPSGPTYTNAAGIAQQTVQLSSTGGLNVFHAFGRGIADNRATGCTIPPSTPSSCNGPRATFDPFLPFHVPEFDPSGSELPVAIPVGTRLPFMVCTRGNCGFH